MARVQPVVSPNDALEKGTPIHSPAVPPLFPVPSPSPASPILPPSLSPSPPPAELPPPLEVRSASVGHDPPQIEVDDVADTTQVASTEKNTDPIPFPPAHPSTLVLPHPQTYSLDDIPNPLPDTYTASDETLVEFDSLVRHLEHELETIVIHRGSLQLSIEYINALKSATLDESSMGEIAIKRLRDPTWTKSIDLNGNEGLRISLEMFIDTITASDETYERVISRLQKRQRNLDFCSRYRIEKRAQELAGTSTIIHDMCPQSCIAYTGALADRDKCTECGTSRWDELKSSVDRKVPARTFTTIALGPQLQALYAEPKSARAMNYRKEKTKTVIEEARLPDGTIQVTKFDDVFSGTAYLEQYVDGTITDDDILLLLSMDGAQLYEYKASDCWLYIWVVLDLAPGERYKKKYVIPGGIIPGPNKPKNLDSFLFPGLHHISALQQEGLKIWNADNDTVFTSRPVILLKTADAPGMFSAMST